MKLRYGVEYNIKDKGFRNIYEFIARFFKQNIYKKNNCNEGYYVCRFYSVHLNEGLGCNECKVCDVVIEYDEGTDTLLYSYDFDEGEKIVRIIAFAEIYELMNCYIHGRK